MDRLKLQELSLKTWVPRSLRHQYTTYLLFFQYGVQNIYVYNYYAGVSSHEEILEIITINLSY